MIPAHIVEVFKITKAVYPRWSLDKETLRAWAAVLADIPPNDLKRAALEHARTSKWPPTPADLIELSHPPTGHTAFTAWGEVCERKAWENREPSVTWDAIVPRRDELRASGSGEFEVPYDGVSFTVRVENYREDPHPTEEKQVIPRWDTKVAPPKWSDPNTAKVLRCLGGLRNLDTKSASDRRQFIDAYKSIRDERRRGDAHEFAVALMTSTPNQLEPPSANEQVNETVAKLAEAWATPSRVPSGPQGA